jgi:general secretion pathway protein C
MKIAMAALFMLYSGLCFGGPAKQPEGFKLVDVQRRSIYEKLGLRKNDVIKRFNGTRIDSPEKALLIFNELKSASSVEIVIERDGKEQTLRYTVN